MAGQETVGQCKRTGPVCKQASEGIYISHGLDVGEVRRTDGVLRRGALDASGRVNKLCVRTKANTKGTRQDSQ